MDGRLELSPDTIRKMANALQNDGIEFYSGTLDSTYNYLTSMAKKTKKLNALQKAQAHIKELEQQIARLKDDASYSVERRHTAERVLNQVCSALDTTTDHVVTQAVRLIERSRLLQGMINPSYDHLRDLKDIIRWSLCPDSAHIEDRPDSRKLPGSGF